MEILEPVIKNKEKYKLIKPVKGLALETFDKVYRSGETGVSTETFGNYWFLAPQGKVLFKNYEVEKEGIRIINELLYDELAKQIGVGKSIISYWEKDLSEPKMSNIIAIAKFFNVTSDFLLGLED